MLVPFLVWLFINQSYLKELESTELWRNFEQEMTSNGRKLATNLERTFLTFFVLRWKEKARTAVKAKLGGRNGFGEEEGVGLLTAVVFTLEFRR